MNYFFSFHKRFSPFLGKCLISVEQIYTGTFIQAWVCYQIAVTYSPQVKLELHCFLIPITICVSHIGEYAQIVILHIATCLALDINPQVLASLTRLESEPRFTNTWCRILEREEIWQRVIQKKERKSARFLSYHISKDNLVT